MIVATHMGLFMPALRPDWEKCLKDGEPELQVRSRRAIDLDRLRAYMLRMGRPLGPTIHLRDTDYQFRAYTTRDHWGSTLDALAQDIDYTKFKDTPAKYHDDKDLSYCYAVMWDAIFNTFPRGSVYNFREIRHSGRRFGKTAAKRTLTYERETVSWKRMSDMNDRELALLMRQLDDLDVDEPTAEELADIERELADEKLDFYATDELNFPVTPMKNRRGHIDHSTCDHAKTKSARRNCARRWAKMK